MSTKCLVTEGEKGEGRKRKLPNLLIYRSTLKFNTEKLSPFT